MGSTPIDSTSNRSSMDRTTGVAVTGSIPVLTLGEVAQLGRALHF